MTLHHEMINGNTKKRRMCWDEENRMLLSADEEQMAAYVYDAAGCSLSFSSKRSTHKASGTNIYSTVNGYPSAFGTVGELTLYPSELLTVSNGMYTKHYYNGSARIASRIGGGFVAHNDLNNYNPLTDHVSLFQTPSYENKADQLRQLWSRSAECAGLDPNLEYAYSLEGGGLYLSLTHIGDGERYFYHSDHLGSSAFITTVMRSIREDLQKTNTPEQNGYATQFLAYTCAEPVECVPYGETLDEQQNGTSYYSPFKFSAKEQDLETGYSYFGARYYSPQLSVWLSVDPMADKLPSWSPYNYTLNNPIGFIDPDGKFPWGVVLGGVAEIAIQVTSNVVTRQKWNRIDWIDVGIAAAAGGATGGLSCVAKLGKLGKLISAASGVTAGAVLDVKTGCEGSADVSIEALGSRMMFPDGTVIEICGQVMEINGKKSSDVGIELMAGGIGDIAKKVLGAALNKDISKKADDITRQLRNSAAGSKGQAKRVDQLNQLNSDMAGNQVAVDKITDLSKSLSLDDVKQLNQ